MTNELFSAYTEIIKRLNNSVKSLEVDDKFTIQKSIVGNDFQYDDLREFTDTISKGSNRYIVIENNLDFDIIRIECNTNLKKVYALLKPQNDSDLTDSRDVIIRLLKVYLESTWDKANSISSSINADMFNDRVLSYSWLQRKTSAISLFKNSRYPSELLHDTICDLVRTGELAEVSEGSYKTKAKLYKIRIAKSNKRVETSKPLELDKQNQLAYITMEAEKLGVLTNKELEITSDIVVTFDDIKAHLDNLSKGPKRYAVAHDTNLNCFRIVRQMDNADLEVVFYMTKKYDPLTDPDRKPAQVDPRDLAERQERDRQDAEDAARMQK